MSKTKEISSEKRFEIVILRKMGKSISEIARMVGVSRNGVRTTLKRKSETGRNDDRKRLGRPRKTTERTDKLIKLISNRNRFKTSPEITAEINNMLSKPISVQTTKRRLREVGLNGCVAVKKPLLSKANIKKRLLFAKQHQHWTIDQWKTVLWTDEPKFEMFGSRRRQFVRRKVGERCNSKCILPTVKHGGGSVMVWGSFCHDGVGALVKINGILKKEQYHSILQRSAIPSGIGLIGHGFILQQDNDPKHTSKLCKHYLEKKEEEGILETMAWPPQSPDINPIELLWDELDRQVRKQCPSNQNDLWNCLNTAWDHLEPRTLQKLVERLPKICAAIIKARGGHIDEKGLK